MAESVSSQDARLCKRRSDALPSANARRRYALTVAVLAVLSLLIGFGHLAWKNPLPFGSAGFWRIAELRATSLAIIVIVSFCQAIATISFQTATHNRIITPSIMGFESLYRLVQSAAIFFFGIAGIELVHGIWQFIAQVVLMVGFAALLYGWLLSGRSANLQVMLLVGVVLGGGLGAGALFMQRLLAPDAFDILSARLVGSVANADPRYLSIALPLAAASGGLLWLGAKQLNVLALGRAVAINLGVDQRRQTLLVLLLVSVLMAVSTALIGPMTFFGFLVATIAYQLVDTYDHRLLLPVAWLLGFVVLGGAYFVLRNVFYAQGAVGVIIEIVGGSCFLAYVVRKGRL